MSLVFCFILFVDIHPAPAPVRPCLFGSGRRCRLRRRHGTGFHPIFTRPSDAAQEKTLGEFDWDAQGLDPSLFWFYLYFFFPFLLTSPQTTCQTAQLQTNTTPSSTKQPPNPGTSTSNSATPSTTPHPPRTPPSKPYSAASRTAIRMFSHTLALAEWSW